MGTGNLGQGTGDRGVEAGNWNREVGGRELETCAITSKLPGRRLMQKR